MYDQTNNVIRKSSEKYMLKQEKNTIERRVNTIQKDRQAIIKLLRATDERLPNLIWKDNKIL